MSEEVIEVTDSKRVVKKCVELPILNGETILPGKKYDIKELVTGTIHLDSILSMNRDGEWIMKTYDDTLIYNCLPSQAEIVSVDTIEKCIEDLSLTSDEYFAKYEAKATSTINISPGPVEQKKDIAWRLRKLIEEE